MMGKKEVLQSCFQFLNFCDFVWNCLYRICSFIFLSVFHFSFFIACLPFGVFSSHTIIFHSYGDGIIAGEGLQILTYSRHTWSFSSEGSLAWNTYYYTGHPFIMVISEDLFHTQLLLSVQRLSRHCLILRLRSGCRGWGSNTIPSACEANALTHCATAAAFLYSENWNYA